ncbi:MAG: type IV pilin protein [Actinomycetota bacterium]
MKDQDGFTLIELMVVILIIAILIAIAIPTFLGLRQRAQNRAAQSNLRNAMTAAKAFYTDNETYVGFTEAVAEGIEPSLNFNTGAASVANQVSIRDLAAGTVALSTLSASGTVYCIAETAPGTTGEGTGEAATAAACVATADW